jgi:hypothetical protein
MEDFTKLLTYLFDLSLKDEKNILNFDSESGLRVSVFYL